MRQLHHGREIANHARAQRYTFRFVILVLPFLLELTYIHIRRTLGFAALAAQAKVHHLLDLFMIKAVHFGGTGEELPQNIGPCAR